MRRCRGRGRLCKLAMKITKEEEEEEAVFISVGGGCITGCCLYPRCFHRR